MIDINKYITDFVKCARNADFFDVTFNMCHPSDTELVQFIFNAIRCHLATINKFGKAADTYSDYHPTAIAVCSCDFEIIDDAEQIWSVCIYRYAGKTNKGNVSTLPYGLRLVLDGAGIFRMQFGSDDDTERKSVQRICQMVVNKLDTELSDEEKVLLMMSKISGIKEFLLPPR